MITGYESRLLVSATHDDNNGTVVNGDDKFETSDILIPEITAGLGSRGYDPILDSDENSGNRASYYPVRQDHEVRRQYGPLSRTLKATDIATMWVCYYGANAGAAADANQMGTGSGYRQDWDIGIAGGKTRAFSMWDLGNTKGTDGNQNPRHGVVWIVSWSLTITNGGIIELAFETQGGGKHWATTAGPQAGQDYSSVLFNACNAYLLTNSGATPTATYRPLGSFSPFDTAGSRAQAVNDSGLVADGGGSIVADAFTDELDSVVIRGTMAIDVERSYRQGGKCYIQNGDALVVGGQTTELEMTFKQTSQGVVTALRSEYQARALRCWELQILSTIDVGGGGGAAFPGVMFSFARMKPISEAPGDGVNVLPTTYTYRAAGVSATDGTAGKVRACTKLATALGST